jgi:hypothetical protein
MKRVYQLPRCRVLLDLKEKTPLIKEDYEKVLAMIPECPMKGIPFDDVSFLYPLQVVGSPRFTVLNEAPRVVSLLVKYNLSTLAGIIGEEELESTVMKHPNAIIYAVGKMSTKEKEGRTYHNLRPRGWLLVEEQGSTVSRSKSKKSSKKA